MNKKLTLISLILLIPSIVLIGLMAYLGSYSQLMADDFCSVHYSERLGILRSVWFWYITWHGGFSAAFADGVLGFFGRTGIGFVVPLTIFIWLIVLAWVVNLILQRLEYHSSYLVAVLFSALVLVGVFILSPSIKTSLLWWGALRGYIPPLIIFPFYIGMFLQFSNKAWSLRNLSLWYLGGFIVLLFNAGFSETFTPLQLIILLGWLLCVFIYYPQQKQNISFLLAGVAGSVLGLILMVAAPGNSQRQTFFPASPALPELTAIVIKGCLYFTESIFNNTNKLMMLIGIIVVGLVFGGLMPLKKRPKPRDIVVILLVGIAFVVCCFPPAAYGQSTFPSDHTLVIPAYILVITLIIFGFILGNVLSSRLSKPGTMAFYSFLLFVLIFVGYAEFITIRTYYLEIPNAVSYAEEWRLRDAQINKAKLAGQETIIVSPINNWIGILEPINNPKFFVNSCMRLYYDINVLSDKGDAFK